MKRNGYDDGLACGVVAAGGTLGILIPPSVPLVIYGILTETDIAKLFIAGILPGLLLSGAYMAAAWAQVALRPSLAQPAPALTWNQRWQSLAKYGASLHCLPWCSAVFTGDGSHQPRAPESALQARCYFLSSEAVVPVYGTCAMR